MFARSMKQNRYSSATVGMMQRSIFSLSLDSAFGSKVTSAWPYLLSVSTEKSKKPVEHVLIGRSMATLGSIMGILLEVLVMTGRVLFRRRARLLRFRHLRWMSVVKER